MKGRCNRHRPLFRSIIIVHRKGWNTILESLVRKYHEPRVQHDLQKWKSVYKTTGKILLSDSRGTGYGILPIDCKKKENWVWASIVHTSREAYTRGKITAHASPPTRHATGISGVESTTTPAMMTNDTTRGNQNLENKIHSNNPIEIDNYPYLFAIFGTSLKKFERSTSFFVALQVMLKENKCARMAWLTGIASPPKKKKLQERRWIWVRSWTLMSHDPTYKNGIHTIFVKKDLTYMVMLVSSSEN